MISYGVYKVVHFIGILMVLMSIGGLAMAAISQAPGKVWRRPVMITHGIGMLVSLVGGFGLLARLGVMHGSLPGWIYAKLAIWFIFGAMAGVLIRKPSLAKPLWVVVIVLGGLAAYLAGNKPF